MAPMPCVPSHARRVLWALLLLLVPQTATLALPLRTATPVAPGRAFNLSGWRLHTCLKRPATVQGAALATYASGNFFLLPATARAAAGGGGGGRGGGGAAMVMRVPDNASYITPHATHPRTELREIGVPDWPLSASGMSGAGAVHTLALQTSVHRVSNTSGETIIAQIHGAADEELAKVLKLQWTSGVRGGGGRIEARVKSRTAPYTEFGLDLGGGYALGQLLDVTVTARAAGTSTRTTATTFAAAASPGPLLTVGDRARGRWMCPVGRRCAARGDVLGRLPCFVPHGGATRGASVAASPTMCSFLTDHVYSGRGHVRRCL